MFAIYLYEKKMKTVVMIVMLGALVACTSKKENVETTSVDQVEKTTTNTANYTAGEVLIGINGTDYKSVIATIEQEYDIKMLKVLMTGETNIIQMGVPKGKEQEFVKTLQERSDVVFAEVNGTVGIN